MVLGEEVSLAELARDLLGRQDVRIWELDLLTSLIFGYEWGDDSSAKAAHDAAIEYGLWALTASRRRVVPQESLKHRFRMENLGRLYKLRQDFRAAVALAKLKDEVYV